MTATIGFIGCGNMGQAILSGILNAGLVKSEDILVSVRSSASMEIIRDKYSVKTADNKSVAKSCDIIFLAVKPNVMGDVILDIRQEVDRIDKPLIISIAAGMTIDTIEKLFATDIKLIRSMPNTPALVHEAMSALCANDKTTDDDRQMALKIFESFGKAEYINEVLMDAVIGVSGSSPAYIYMMIEAMADGAVKYGMPREMAYKFAAQSVMGSAKMVLETAKHPGELKDNVCSPGGTTIEAVSVLEKCGFRDAIISAESACIERSINMSKRQDS